MAYDEELAGRIRALIASHGDLTEMRMFGGLAFLIGEPWVRRGVAYARSLPPKR